MRHLSDKSRELGEEYYKIFGEPPRGWAHGEETMKEYEEYLKKKIEDRAK